MGADSRSGFTSETDSGVLPPGGALSFAGLHPHIGTEAVHRNGVVAHLLASRAPMVVISAPAGSGKTTALIQWVALGSRPQAWLQLEPPHNDPVALVADLVTVLGQVASIDPKVHEWTHSPMPPVKTHILPSLRASLMEASPFQVVLDDGHVLADEASWRIIETLLDAFPAGAQLAIATRAEPPLPLARLEAAGRLLQMGGEELAFSKDETDRLLRLHGLQADEAASSALHDVTEGWAAGISLACLACGESCTSEWVATLDGRHKSIARYLTSEVLERQDPEVRSFLLETSILARLSDGCCRAVTGRTDSGRLLARLSRDNLFITSLDEKGQWYRYHHLFGELLGAELARRDGSCLPELHRRAAAWWQENGDLGEAVHHWLAAGEVKRAGDAVCLGHFQYSGRGQYDTVRRWIECFTGEQIRSHTALALVAGTLTFMCKGDFPGWVDIALSVPVDDSPLMEGCGTSRAYQTMLRALAGEDGSSAMLRDAEEAARLGVETHPAWSTSNNMALGIARWLDGDTAAAESAFRRGIRDGYPMNIGGAVLCAGYLALMFGEEGRWEEAEVEVLGGRQRLEDSDLEQNDMVTSIPLAEARMLAHRGEPVPEEMIAVLEEHLADFRLPAWQEIVCTVHMALVAMDMGDMALVERWTARSESILRAWPEAGTMCARVEELRRTLREQRGVAPLTAAESRVLGLLASHHTLPEIAGDLVISQNTLKTHVRHLYRKLGVHSRAKAVERARETGLLTS